MGKQWRTEKNEFQESKYNELYELLDQIADRFAHLESAKTLARVVVEEVSNVIDHDKKWTSIKVNMEYSNEADNIKIEIFHDGELFDPEKHGVSNVIGSTSAFEKYERNTKSLPSSNPGDEIVEIRLQVKPGKAKGN